MLLITFDFAKGAMTSFDYIEISANNKVDLYVDVTGESYIFEGETATVTQGISVKDDVNTSGGKYLGNVCNNYNATITYKLNVSEATKATMFINMALGGTFTDNPFKISLNGVDLEVPTSYKDPQGNWTHFQEYKVALLNLVQGENEVVITITGGCGNFDYIKIISPKSIA